MKKLVALPALLAVSLGLAACAKHDESANTALANDLTLNSEEVLADENSASLDANTTDLNATEPGFANAADLGGNEATVGNAL